MINKIIHSFIVVMALLWLNTAGANNQLSRSPLAYQIKAAFMVKFFSFMEWPDDRFPDSEVTQIAVYGESPVLKALKSLPRKKYNNRRLVVKKINSLEEMKCCQMLFLSSEKESEFPKIIKALKGSNVLTVSDTPNFGTSGGIVNFYIEDKKVHFEINYKQSREEKIYISSKVLKLAKIVQTK